MQFLNKITDLNTIEDNGQQHPNLSKKQKANLSRKKKHSVGKTAWNHHLARLQNWYDRDWSFEKKGKALRKYSGQIRRYLTKKHGFNQAPLDKGCKALNVEGVIYCIFCIHRPKLLYIGQTIYTAFHRFKQHCWKAWEGASTPLANLIRSYGFESFRVFPLEVIPKEKYEASTRRGSVKKFFRTATWRECFWIERLHTYQPLGLNVLMSKRKRHRPHRNRKNPMAWRRKRSNVANKVNVSTEPKSMLLMTPQKKKVTTLGFFSPSPVKKVTGKRRPKASSHTSRLYGYRDNQRRCKYLAHLFDLGKLDSVKLELYKSRILWRMRKLLLENGKESKLKATAVKAIVEKLNNFLFTRIKRKPKVPTGVIPIKLEWQSSLMRRINLRRILEAKEIRDLFPDAFPEVVIAKRLTNPISCRVLNYSKTSRNLRQQKGRACRCRQLFDKKFRTLDNCVYTGDLGCVKDVTLRSILSHGLRFRTNVKPQPLLAVSAALSEFISQMCKRLNKDKREFMRWKASVIAEVKKRLPARITGSGVSWTGKAQNYLSFLQQHLVLVPTDKASNNITFVCRRLYVSILKHELDREDGAYEVVTDESVDDIVLRHKNFLKRFSLEAGSKSGLGYLYWLPKMHKPKAAQRFIAGLANCSTTTCSKYLAKALNATLRILREKDDAALSETGVRRFFVVPGYEEVAEFISRWPRTDLESDRRLYVGDFSTMYTTIQHADLIKRVHLAIDEAFEWKANRIQEGASSNDVCLSTRGDSCTWVIKKGRKREHFASDNLVVTCLTLKEMVTFIVYNTYVVNGKICRKQVIGIPMGTNCAPPLANLYLYSYESGFIDRLVKAKGMNAAHKFHMTFRLIDDVLSVDNRLWTSYASRTAEEVDADGVGGIYPSALTLNDESISSQEVCFLGMRITCNGQVLCSDVYDKRKDFPFKVIRYPHMNSVLPEYIPYGVYIGQLHRCFRICSDFKSFLREAVEISQTLERQGCVPTKLRRCFNNFISRVPIRRWKVTITHLKKLFVQSFIK